MIPIIVLNWNGINDTRECISALEKQKYRDFIIWLMDNGSDTAESENLRREYTDHPKVRLVLNEGNLGFTKGNNRTLETVLNAQSAVHSPQSAVGSQQPAMKSNEVSTSGSAVGSQHSVVPYVVLLNNDTVPSPQWLEELVRTAQEQRVDMVSSKMIQASHRDRMDNAGHILLNTLEVLPWGHDEPVGEFSGQSAVRSPKSSRENMGACGGAALYSTRMLRDIGIFDEHFTNGYEDVELGLRAILCGYKSVYAPGAVVAHKGSQSINKIRNFSYTLDIQRHIYYITFKLFPWPVILLCLPFMAFRFGAALIINLIALRWKFLRIQIVAIYCLLFKDLQTIREARRKFLKTHKIISTRRIIGKMHFFWRYDWARFKKYILRREKMVFERY